MKNAGLLILRFFLMILVLVAGISCDPFWGEVPGDDPLSVYDSFWDALNRDYAGFYTKTGTDWNQVRIDARADLEAHPTEGTLLSELQMIMNQLNDGHMLLEGDSFVMQGQPSYSSIPFDHDVTAAYLEQGRWDSSGYIYTGFAEPGIGYLYLPTFGGEGWTKRLSAELDRFADCEYLMIDLRSNGGGSSDNGEDLLELFISAPEVWGRALFHQGPGRSPVEVMYSLTPAGGAPRPYHLVLLVNEASCSTTDMVICGFQAFTDVHTIGRPHKAELVGNNYPRELPNGWILRLGTVNSLMIGDSIIDGDILPVDQDVSNHRARLLAGHDDQLETALSWIVAQP